MSNTLKYEIRWETSLQFLLNKLAFGIWVAVSVIMILFVYYKYGLNISMRWFFPLLIITILWLLNARHKRSLKKVVKITIDKEQTTLYFVTNSLKRTKATLLNNKTKLELYENRGQDIRRKLIFHYDNLKYYCLDNSGLWDYDDEILDMFKEIKERYKESFYISR